MKKILALGSSIFTTLLFAVPAFADTTLNPCPANGNVDPATNGYHTLCDLNPSNALPFIFTWVIILAIIIALAFLIWGGIRWIMSGGDKTKVETARGTIIAAIVGLIIIFLAWFIINLLTGVFFGKSLNSNFQLPQINTGGGNQTTGNGSQTNCGTPGSGC